MIEAFIQRHLLSMSTPATGLRCIGWIDLDELPTSFFRFARQLREKGRPSRICYRLCQAMIMHHAIDREIFNTDHAETIHDLTTVLMGEVFPFPLCALMHTGDDLASFASF